jgi:thymidylate synthase (FAD)
VKLHLIASSGLKGGWQTFLEGRNLKWQANMPAGEAERLVEFAGRVCYMSFGDLQSNRTNKEYIGNLISQGHESVLEHANFTLLADGISRSLSHQLVRHRVGFAYSQLSQQYHDERQAEFALPPELGNESGAAKEWGDAVRHARDVYAALVARLTQSTFASYMTPKERMRAIRSIARGVLPNATKTTLVMTGNARAWRHLLKIRGAIIGDMEMRRFCFESWELLRGEAPAMFGDFDVVTDEMGTFVKARPE